jgi:hypothetical protein
MKNNNLLIRKDMDVNEHERLSNCTHKTQTKERNRDFIAVLHFTVTVGSSIMSISHTLK